MELLELKYGFIKGEVFAREFSQETNKVTPKEGKE
jgi:small subunit ribosomal protein S3